MGKWAEEKTVISPHSCSGFFFLNTTFCFSCFFSVCFFFSLTCGIKINSNLCNVLWLSVSSLILLGILSSSILINGRRRRCCKELCSVAVLEERHSTSVLAI